MNKQPLEVQTLYAELIERLMSLETQRTIGRAKGTFVTKIVKGETYYYFQHSVPGGTKRQVYLGKKDAALDAVVERFQSERVDIAEDRTSIERLCSLLRVGGAQVTDAATARVLEALSDAGVFGLGGVLVGTHAFAVLGNLLGVTWDGAGLKTQDIDIAAEPTVGIAVPDMQTDVPGVLDSLGMGFLPVPALDRKHSSTSFKVRGQGLRVDLLTPGHGNQSQPVKIPRLQATAKPLRFLGYILEESVRAAVIDGGGVLVSVPDPARFAFHKLIVSGARPVAMHAKRDKDLLQATQVFSILAEERPGDLARAWEAIAGCGAGWVRRTTQGMEAMARIDGDVAKRVSIALGL
ncbi:MAG: GSU2403 family nucleotidyltransferase fold protein [Actinomycetota bacterium]|nr:GSU2403 family nucleotidyltransferase fold protein [Actinomycetota bacterium]